MMSSHQDKLAMKTVELLLHLYEKKDWVSMKPMMSDPIKVEFKTQDHQIGTILSAEAQLQRWDKNLQGRRIKFNIQGAIKVAHIHQRCIVRLISKSEYYIEETGQYDFSEMIEYHFYLDRLDEKTYRMVTLKVNASLPENQVVLNRSPLVKSDLYHSNQVNKSEAAEESQQRIG